MNLFNLKDICVEKGNQLILDKITFSVPKNKCFVIAGDNGTGKSTLLRLFNRLEKPSAGEIHFLGKDIKNYPIDFLRNKISMVMQGPVLPDGKVIDFLDLIDKLFKLNYDFEKQINSIGLDSDILQKKTESLSGGETQLIALIAVLMKKPEILLLDEITSALSHSMTENVRNIIKDFKVNNGSIIIVSHRKSEIKMLGDEGIVLKKNGLQQYSEITNLIDNLKEK